MIIIFYAPRKGLSIIASAEDFTISSILLAVRVFNQQPAAEPTIKRLEDIYEHALPEYDNNF